MAKTRTIRFDVREMRQAQGVTQTQLANRVGISQSHACKLERGDMLPSLELAWKIAQELGCTIEELIRLEDDTAKRLQVMREAEARNKERVKAWEEARSGKD